MAEYQLTATDENVIRTIDQAWIPNDPLNRDWQAYQAWLDEGGVPDPYVPPPNVPPTDALAEAERANARLDAGVDAVVSTVVKAPRTPRADPLPTDPVTQEQFAVLQAQVDELQAAFTAMVEAHAKRARRPADPPIA
jgi:hypothetical protein